MKLFKWLMVAYSVLFAMMVTPSWATTSTNKQWTIYTLSGNYGSFLYNIEPQLRLIERNNQFNQFLTNAGGGFEVAPGWQLWLGQTLGTTSQDADPNDFEEYRIWEQIVWQHPINSVLLTSRTRLEQRKSFDFSSWANRIRERVLLNIPFASHLSLVLSDELLINLNQVEWITTKTWDQNRAYVGLLQKLTNSTSIGFGYMNQWIFTPVVQSDQVLALNIQVNLAL